MTLLIDVRSPEEFAAGHLEGAVNIPVGDMVAGNLGHPEGVEKDALIQMYCLSGARAGYACALLQSEGFSQVTNLGGMEDAKKAIL